MEDINISEEQRGTIINFVKKELKEGEPLTPRQIVSELDKFIIGQGNAKKSCGNRTAQPLEKTTSSRRLARRNYAE